MNQVSEPFNPTVRVICEKSTGALSFVTRKGISSLITYSQKHSNERLCHYLYEKSFSTDLFKFQFTKIVEETLPMIEV